MKSKTEGILRVIFCISFFLSFCPASFANQSDANFLKGNEYYQNGEYRSAILEYEKILQSGYESWEVYYNLGNAYFKDGQLARSILNYERAKLLNPDNEDILFNLEFANLSIADRIQEILGFFLTDWFAKTAHLFSLSTLTIIVLSIYILVIVIIIMRMLLRAFRASRISFVTLTATGVILVLMTSLFLFRIVEKETRVFAIVLADKVDVKSAPNKTSTDVFTLHEGLKVQIEDSSLDWVKIKLSDGKVGWLKRDVVENI